MPEAFDHERRQSQKKMLNALAIELVALVQDNATLHALYGARDRVDLLRSMKPDVWGTVQRALVTSLLLGIRRITDGPKSNGKGNWSFEGVLSQIGLKQSERDVIMNGYDSVKDKIEVLRHSANKGPGHMDPVARMTPSSIQYDPADSDRVVAALCDTHAALSQALDMPVYSFDDWRKKATESANSLIEVLRRGSVK